MKIKQISYPHPVLAEFNDDYIESKFEVELDYVIKEHSTEFKVDFRLNNGGIKKLIQEGKAIYVTHVECESSMYRQAFDSTMEQYTFEVANRKLAKQVDVTFMVVATTKIEKYSNSLLHEDYEGMPLIFNKGTYLAVHVGYSLILEKDPIVPTKSIFNIVASNDNETDSYKVRLEDHTIGIVLPKKTYALVEELSLRDEINALLISIYYLPALIEALIIIASDEETVEPYEEYEWYKSLLIHLQKLNIDVQSIKNLGVATVANKIFEEVAENALKSLEKIYL
ncbi:hypothetical protein ACIQ1H_16965 [Lysinibacillus sp. NPDC097279]|uniref:hypothetical protein n=1 Tax=Lysinibacillus sp. NPDC097279 TaxID=3364143 RepID=UPI00382E5554